MYLNVLKGSYPSLQQIDKTLDVGAESAAIVRGSVMKVDASGTVPVFVAQMASDSKDASAFPFFCLMPDTELTAGMAGTAGQGVAPGTYVDPASSSGVSVAGVARVTGLSVGMNAEFETDMFVDAEYTVGELLTVGDYGKLASHGAGDNVVAQVTTAVRAKWVNNAWAVVGRRTGANVNVLTARMVWMPKFTA